MMPARVFRTGDQTGICSNPVKSVNFPNVISHLGTDNTTFGSKFFFNLSYSLSEF